MPLLTTKFYFPPARPRLVVRPQLTNRLEQGLKGPLTLISAPAGYGKTTLMSEWRKGNGKGIPTAWLSLDAGDNDLTRFLQYLTAALEIIQPGLAAGVEPLLLTSELPNAEAILTFLINCLNDLKQDAVVVLDDYHLIGLPSIHKALNFLIDYLPPRLHLVLLTRADPSIPLARLRARGQLTEIRTEHLRFNPEDTARFLNQVMALRLTGEQVSALERRTEGWIAGLQLAALSLQECEDIQGFISAFTGSDHYVVDYLAEEVLGRLPETLQDFLLQTSILERLTGSLCDALTGQTDGHTVLEKLDHANLFIISLDNEQHWFRFHRLFANLLNSRLLHSRPDAIPLLHAKASEWFEVNGFLDEAINHALVAQDYDRAARLFCREQMEIIYTRPISTLDRWLVAFPERFLRTIPWLCIAKAHVLWTSGRPSELVSYVMSAEKAFAEMVIAGSITEGASDYQKLMGYILTFKAMAAYVQHEYASMEDLCQRAVAIIPKNTRMYVFALGGLYLAYELTGDIVRSTETCSQAMLAARQLNYPSMHATASYTLAHLLRIQGRLHQAEVVVREALAYVERKGQGRLFYNGILNLAIAEIKYEWNALEDMQTELATGLALCRQGGMNILVPIGLCATALLKHGRGDWLGALDTLQEIEHECKEMDPTVYRETCKIYRLRWQAEQGKLTGLEENVSQVNLAVDAKPGVERFYQLMHASQFLYFLGKYEDALRVLQEITATLTGTGLTGWLIHTLVLQSVTWNEAGNVSRGLDCLKQAIHLAEPEGYLRVFLNQGKPMQRLLRTMQLHPDPPSYASKLLDEFSKGPSEKQAAPARGEAVILSKREIELLTLIAAGYSNKEVAIELVITVDTVKRHVTNIFNKLDAKNRTDAVAKARKLGLL